MSAFDSEKGRGRCRPLIMLMLLVALALAAPGAAPARAQSLDDAYVATSGNDANTCATPQTPCRTIQAAISKTATGGAVHVGPGAYAENIQMKSGVSVIGAGPTNTSIVGAASVSGVVSFANVTYAALQGFRIRISAPAPGVDRGVVFSGSTDRTAVLRNNIIQYVQYGIFVWYPSSPTIENNTLVGEPDEQGIYIGNSAASPLIRSNIITGFSYGIHVVAGTASPTPVILYNDMWSNTENYRNYPSQTGANGNISADPAFVNAAAQDFHLRNTAPASPAIDAGDPGSAYNREPGPHGSRINIGVYGNTIEAATTPGNTKLITFESPSLGADSSRVINPYVDSATGVTFQRDGAPSPNYVVGLVKNSGTSACVDPADSNQKLGIGIDNGGVGFSSTAVRATFPTTLNPPVVVSAVFQTGVDQPLRIRLFGPTGNQVAANTETSWPANGTCGMPGDPRARTAVTAISTQPVAYAVIDMDTATASRVFVLDDFRFTSAGTHTISNVGLSPASPANLLFNQYVNITFDYLTSWPAGVHIWARPMSGGSLTPNYAAHGSPLYPAGSGSGTGYFTISGGNAIVDSIRFQMWTPDGSQLLLEQFVPVNYRFSNGCYVLTRTHTGSGADPVATPVKSNYCVSNGQFLASDFISLSASPATGWKVSGWSGTANDASTATSNSLVMPASSRTVRVDYVVNCFTLTLTHTGSGGDPVATPAKSAVCANNGQYLPGEAISLSASPATGWKVSGWSGTANDASTATSNSLVMPASSRTVRVDYITTCYTLTLAHTGSGSNPIATPANSSGCPTGRYRAGEPISLSAAAAAGWWISGWIGANNDASTASTNELAMPDAEYQVIVKYATTCYQLTLSHVGAGSDPVSIPAQSAVCSPGYYVAGDPIALHAAPATGWRVASWSGVSETASTSTDNSLTMPTNNHAVNVTYEQMSTAVAGDAYEEDDLCTQARTINADGIGQDHTFHQAGDVDWIRFDATASTPYRVEVSIPTGSPADVNLMLYNQCEGAPVDQFDAAFTAGARLDFTPLTAGPIYVQLSNQDTQTAGASVTYLVSVRSLQAEMRRGNRVLILVGGSLTTPDRLQSNINYVTQAVYAHFRSDGLDAENIVYLTDATGIAGRTGPATVEALQDAITVWAKQQLTVGGLLTLYLMDHGDDDVFYLGNANGHTLSPAQLDSWLDELEEAIPEIKITVIIEACYSGSFIEGAQSISKDEPGRLVITSTSHRLLAYASSNGAYFSDFILASLEQGYSLHNSFKATYAVVREMSNLRQDPQLDANGNGVANESADVILTSQNVSGGGQGWAPYIVSAEGPITIMNQSGALLAIVLDDKKVQRVWAVITPPSYQPPENSAELVPETLPTLVLLEQGKDTFSATYTSFDEPGLYRIAVYAEDEDKLASLPKFVEVLTGSRIYVPFIAR